MNAEEKTCLWGQQLIQGGNGKEGKGGVEEHNCVEVSYHNPALCTMITDNIKLEWKKINTLHVIIHIKIHSIFSSPWDTDTETSLCRPLGWAASWALGLAWIFITRQTSGSLMPSSRTTDRAWFLGEEKANQIVKCVKINSNPELLCHVWWLQRSRKANQEGIWSQGLKAKSKEKEWQADMRISGCWWGLSSSCS